MDACPIKETSPLSSTQSSQVVDNQYNEVSPIAETIFPKLPAKNPKPLNEREAQEESLLDPTSHTVNALLFDDVVALGTVKTPEQAAMEGVVNMPEAKTEARSGLVMLPCPDEIFDEDNYQKYLNGSQAQLAFSTAAMPGEGMSRSVELIKKVEGENVRDTNRQEQFNIQFAKMKHLLGLGGREGIKNLPVDYSVSYHFITVSHESGKKVYDLLDKDDIRKLRSDVGLDPASEAKINEICCSLREINRDMKKLIEREAGKQKDHFAHDYIGDPNGLEIDRSTAKEVIRMQRDTRHGRNTSNLVALGLANKKGLLSRPTLTPAGAKAFNQVLKFNYLHAGMIKRLQNSAQSRENALEKMKGQKELDVQEVQRLETELKELNAAIGKISQVDRDSIERNLLELEGKHFLDIPMWNGQKFVAPDPKNIQEGITGRELLKPSGATIDQVLGPTKAKTASTADKAEIVKTMQFELMKDIAQRHNASLENKNKEWTWNGAILPSRTPHETSLKEKRHATAIAMQFMHLPQATRAKTGELTERLEVLQVNQRINRETFTKKDDQGKTSPYNLGSQTFKMPKQERFLLHAIEGVEQGKVSKDLLGPFGHAPEYIKKDLKDAIDSLAANKDTDTLNMYTEGQTYNSKELSKKGMALAPPQSPKRGFGLQWLLA